MWIAKVFSNLSIRKRIFLSYVVILFTTLIIVFVVNSVFIINNTTQNMEYSAKQALIQTKSFLEFKTTSVKNLLETFVINESLKEIMEKIPSDYENNIGLWTIDTQNIDKVFYNGSVNPDIDRIQLYMKNGPASVLQNEEFLNLNDYENSPWVLTYIKKLNRVQWFESKDFENSQDTGYLSALRSIPSDRNVREILGIVKIDIPKNVFHTILDQAVITPSTMVVLLDGTSRILCSSENISIHPEDIRSILDYSAGIKPGIWKNVHDGPSEILIGVDEIANSDWRLLMIIPKKDITLLVNKTRGQLVTIFLIITILTFPLAFLVSSSVTRPISRLIKNMKEVEGGNFDVDILPSGNDEIGVLTRNYNYMLTRIAMLLNEKYIMGKEIKNKELKALQAQINPHFLYNTLDQIYWLAVKHNIPIISDLVLSLSRFYKLSLSNGKDMVTLENELEHVKVYTKIQNIRYNNCISLEIDVPENLLHVKLPKILLQPIVENAIIHGILETEEECGRIRITGEIADGIITLRVIDSGMGMSHEKTESILVEDASQDYHGYGIKNIHHRLQLSYGPEYGLSFESSRGHGTTVSLRFPVNS